MRVLPKVTQIPATGNDVRVMNRFEEYGDTRRLMLAVTIRGNQHFEPVVEGVFECGNERRAIPAVFGMGDNVNIGLACQEFPGAIGGTVIDYQNVGTVFA